MDKYVKRATRGTSWPMNNGFFGRKVGAQVMPKAVAVPVGLLAFRFDVLGDQFAPHAVGA